MAEANQKKLARRQAREQVFSLLYETEFHDGDTPEQILRLAEEDSERGLDAQNAYLRSTYLGVMQHIEEIDALIGRFAKGWKTNRLSRVSRAILRLGTYELKYAKGVPAVVAINEAVELTKVYDEPRARAFVNGVLNAIKDTTSEGAPPIEVSASTETEELAESATSEAPAEADTE